MKVRKIIARSMSEGLKAVSAELGPDAMILSNRKVERGIEIMAAVRPEAEVEAEQGPAAAEPVSRPDLPGRAVEDPPISDPEPASSARLSPAESAGRAAAAEPAFRHRASGDRPSHSRPQPARNSEDAFTDSIIRLSDRDTGGLSRESLLSLMETHQDPLEEKRRKLREQLEAEQSATPRPTRSPSSDVGFASLSQSRGASDTAHARRDAAPEPARPAELRPRQGGEGSQELAAMRNELASLRSWLEERQPSATSQPSHPLGARLDRLGFDARCVQPLVDRFGSGNETESWRRSAAQIATILERNAHCLIRKGGVAAFVGPTGAGKTTTLSKVATRFAMQHGAADLGIISLDQYRIGAHEPVRILGRILGCDIQLAEPGDALEDLLHRFRDKTLILLDTNGSDRGLDGFIQQTGDSVIEQQIQTMLVLPANLSPSALNRAWETYGRLRPRGVVLTKTDESAEIGGVLSLSLRKKLPLAYWSDGTQVPQDLHFGNIPELLQRSDRSLCSEQENREKRASIG